MPADLIAEVHAVARIMDTLQRRLLKAGLAATAKKVNEAVQRLGYEAADLQQRRLA